MQIVEIIVSVLLLFGSFFVVVGAIGLLKLPDFYTRLHAPTKATTLGIGATLLASMVFFSFAEGALRIQELVIVLFLFITAPVSATMISKAAIHREIRSVQRTTDRELEPSIRSRDSQSVDTNDN